MSADAHALETPNTPTPSAVSDADAAPPTVVVDTPVNIKSLALAVVAAGVAIGLLRYMQDVLIPLGIATLLFYALDPPVNRLQQWRVPRALGAALVLCVFVSGVVGLGYALQDQVSAVAEELPASARKFREATRKPSAAMPETLEKVDEAAKELQKGAAPPAPEVVRVQVEQAPFKVGDYLWSSSMGVLSFMNQTVMILFLTYFMLLSDNLFKRKFVELAGPTLARKKVTVQILDEIAGHIERFLLIQLLTSALVAVATGGALWALGLRQAALWGLIAGVFNSIPYYGPLLVTSALAVVAFLQFGTLGMTATVAIVALVITSLEGMILTPILMGRVAQINRVSMFAGLLFWTWMWGVWGLLLAVPMMMTVKAVCDRVEDFQPIGRFLGE